MIAPVVIALALLAAPSPYTDRLHERRAASQSDATVATARRIETQLRARVQFQTDPQTATIRVVLLANDRTVSIAAFRYNAASWAVERVEYSTTDGGYDRATPVATRSDLSSATVLALESLLRAPGWGTTATGCRKSGQIVVTVRFREGARDFAGCPTGPAAAAVRILDGDDPAGAQ